MALYQKGNVKIAGRVKGTPNKKKKLKVSALLAALDKNPAQEIIDLIPELEVKDQVKAWENLLAYCQAKPTTYEDDDESDESRDPLEKESSETLATILSIAKEKQMRE